jgi:molecular chaperone GrpE
MLRRQAEFENFRRRQDRDRSDFLQYAGMEIVREILPILDDFERALKIECRTPSIARVLS